MPRRSGRKRQTNVGPPSTRHPRSARGKVAGAELPKPESLGLQNRLEVKIWLALKKHHIPFRTQISFDGGGLVYGGPRTDFVLQDRPVIVEPLGVWHDMPGAALRDDRKRDADRRSGYNIISIREVEAVTLEQCEMNLMAKVGSLIVS